MIVHTVRTIAVAHHLPNYEGKCHRLHGHNLKIEITVDGAVDEYTGMVVDFAAIKSVIDSYDHKNLNDYLETPTAENFARLLAEKINELGAFDKVVVRVYESDDSYAEYILKKE